MNEFIQAFQTAGHGVAYAVLVLCCAGAVGLGFGNIGYKGIKLGIGGALFSGIAFAHFGVTINGNILEFVREFGLILFVYSIGVQVGPGFFASLRHHGLVLNGLAAAIVVFGTATAVIVHLLSGLELPAVLGILSGATTNTPSLAAAQQVLSEFGGGEQSGEILGMAYAVAYPFGIMGILITMLLIRFAFRVHVAGEAEAFDTRRRAGILPMETMNIAVLNPNMDGLKLKNIPGFNALDVTISRVLHDGRQLVADPNHRLKTGDVVLAIGPAERLKDLRLILGQESDIDLKAMPSDLKWERMVVTNAKALGKSISEMRFRSRFGVTISRVNRSGVELTPSAALHLQFGDILTVIGEEDRIREVVAVIGNKAKKLQHAQIAPIFIGIALGVLVGSIPLHIPGMPAAVKLGLAGGPLIVAIIFSRLGHVGPLVWFMPPPVNAALREIGIVLFLTCVGLKSGGAFVDTLVNGPGLTWMFYGVFITLVPLLFVAVAARIVLKQNYLVLCGVLAGSMTDPPALAFANSLSSSEAQALSYAAVYPLTMFLRVIAPQIVVFLFY